MPDNPRRPEEHPPLRLPETPTGEPIPAQSTPETEGYVDPGPDGALERVFPEGSHATPNELMIDDRVYEPAMQPVLDHPISDSTNRSPEPKAADHSAEVGYQTTYQLKQGLFGERLATEALAADGHQVLLCKREIQGTNQGGFDIVTLKGDKVWLVDNKAFTTGRDISSASALTTNFDANLDKLVDELKTHAADTANDPQLRQIHDAYTQAVELVESGQYQKATTGYALALEGEHTTAVSAKLESQGIEHIPLRTEAQGLEPVFSDSASTPTAAANVSPPTPAAPPPTTGPGGSLTGR